MTYVASLQPASGSFELEIPIQDLDTIQQHTIYTTNKPIILNKTIISNKATWQQQ